MLAGSTALPGTRAEGVPAESGRSRRWGFADAYRLGVGAITGALAAFLLLQAIHWPPHEDETLVFFVSREPLTNLFSTVFEERGGAPLHFLLAHAVDSVWSSLLGLRLISVVFALASVPVTAALVARLTDKRTALVATAIAAASWMAAYHGIYARMYSLFLFTSALSFLLLLRALGRRNVWPWVAWGLVTLAAIATQPYGAFVLGAGALFAVVRRRWDPAPLRPALVAVVATSLLALPLWLVYRVLANRFDVGVTGSSGSNLGSPVDVLAYLVRVAGDFTAGWTPAVAIVLLVALVGLVALARERPQAALLTGAVVLVPTAAFLVTRSGGSVSFEKGAPFGHVIVQRADPKLALDTLAEARKPLGRGVWIFDATDQLDASKQRFSVASVSPGPQFEVRAFGPFLVIRTPKPVLTAETFFRDTAIVEYQGRLIGIGDAGLNYQTAVTALARIQGRR